MASERSINAWYVSLNCSTEASLQDNLAKLAYMAGWDVKRELHVQGWGRPDLWIEGPENVKVAVEVKLSLTRAANIRKAFQQADVYARALDDDVLVILTAPVINKELAAPYDDAFPAVVLWDTQYFADWLYGATLGMRERHLIAFDRQQDAQHTLDQHIAVLRRASEIERSPLAFSDILLGPDSSEKNSHSRQAV